MINRLVYFSCLMCLCLPSCIPSFKPEDKVVKELKDESISIKWVKSVGILDQNFPGYIIIEQVNERDTICSAYNIASMDLLDTCIVIGFHGAPEYFNNRLLSGGPKYGYHIITDTTKTN